MRKDYEMIRIKMRVLALLVCVLGPLGAEAVEAVEAEAPSTNLALRKKVTTSVPQIGNHAPEFAVDGKAENDSTWWGVRYPASLQVDLEKSFQIDLARVVFYSDDHRFYQYTIDVSQDGTTWKSVADHSRDTSPSPWDGHYVKFPPIDARYARLNILKNSANESVHVAELEVYEKGKGPAALKRDKDGFLSLFNGKDLTGWTGDTKGYVAEDGRLICRSAGNLLTKRIFTNFVFRFEFKLMPGANNGIAFRQPAGSDGGPKGEEIQILDDSAPEFRNLHDYQYHGSLYGVIPAKRGHLKPVGEWNDQEVMADGSKFKITLNEEVIVDADLSTITQTPQIHDLKGHPGLHNPAGRLGFLGHVPLSGLEFRNIRIKEL
jgi:hypothetical protein